MGIRRPFRAVAAVAIVAGTLMGTSQSASAADPAADTTRDWSYSDMANGYWRPPVPSSPPAADATVWKQYNGTKQIRCPEDDPAFACSFDEGSELTGIICGDVTGPRGLPTYAWIRWERKVDPDGTATKWVGKEADCDEPGEDDFVPMQEISYTIYAEVFRPVGQPDLDLWQRGQVVTGRVKVKVPVVLASDYPLGPNGIDPALLVSTNPMTVRIPVHVPRPGGGLDAVVTATVGYQWTWNGGSANGRGIPYEPSPYPVKYLTATFHQVGSQTLTLTVTWTGTAVAETLAPEQVVPIEVSAATGLAVVQ